MGWGHGTLADGTEVGYLVEDVCSADCTAEIDRGLAYCCGGMHGGGEHGCGRYFCAEHLFFTGNEAESAGAQLCIECSDRWLAAHPNEGQADG